MHLITGNGMIVDSRSLDHGQQLSCDICIVGGGAAGITLAAELDRTRLDVILLEAGGLNVRARAQDDCRGEVADTRVHPALHYYRRRVLGGTTAVWGGCCIPLDPIDFEARPFVPHSGWPIDYDEVAAYYPGALDYCECGPAEFTAAQALPGSRPELLAGAVGNVVRTDQVERFSPPTHFGRKYKAALANSANVRVLLNAICLKLHTDASGRVVDHATVASNPRERFSVRARQFVLAAGALEVTRLMLLSNDVIPTGLGNQRDNVGRFYMSHIQGSVSTLRLNCRRVGVAGGYERSPEGVYCRRYLSLSPESQKAAQILNISARLDHPPIIDPQHGDAILSAMYLAKDFVLPEYASMLTAFEISALERGQRQRPAFWLKHLHNIVRGAPQLAVFSYDWTRRRIIARRKLPSVLYKSPDDTYCLDFNSEQAPNPDSRVSLCGERDRFGLHQLRVEWRMCELDVASIVRAHRLLRDHIGAAGWGKLVFDDAQVEDAVRACTPVGGHQIGTTRMAQHPCDGVVDPDGRVFETANLYVAGSSVFPTSGFANPTLTIVALALRLADYLRTSNGLPTSGRKSDHQAAARLGAPRPAALRVSSHA